MRGVPKVQRAAVAARISQAKGQSSDSGMLSLWMQLRPLSIRSRTAPTAGGLGFFIWPEFKEKRKSTPCTSLNHCRHWQHGPVGLRAAVSAGGHRHLLHGAAGLCPDPQVRRRHAPAVRQLLHEGRPGRQGGHVLLPGPDHRHRRPGGHRQHHRLRHRPLSPAAPAPSSGCG